MRRRGFLGGLRLALVAGGLVIVAALSSCATQKDVTILQRQIWAVQRDVQRLETQMVEMERRVASRLQPVENTMHQMAVEIQALEEKVEAERKPLQRTQAAMGAQLDQLKLEIAKINGRLEETTAADQRQRKDLATFKQEQLQALLDIQKKIDDLGKKLAIMATSLGVEEVRPGERPTAAPKKTAATKPPPPPSPADLYEKTFKQYQDGRYQEARAGFRQFLELYPQHELADNALFWLGECYYAEGKYREAIPIYERLLKTYSQGDKVSSALLKEGMAFAKLGDKTAAAILFRRLLREYPDSSQAKIARHQLDLLQ